MRKLTAFFIVLLIAVSAFATVSTNPGRNEYTATAGQTIFNYTFKIYESTDLNVYITADGDIPNDTTDITAAYTVSGVGVDAGGSITLNSGATLNDAVTIVSNIPSSRTIDYQFNGDFRPNVVNNDFDRTYSIAKQTEGAADKSLRYQESDQTTVPVLPPPEASTVIGYNSSGGITNLSLAVDGNSWDGLDDLSGTDAGKGSDLVGWVGNPGKTVTDGIDEVADDSLPLVGGTMTGDVDMDNGTSLTPSLGFDDELNDSRVNLYMIGESLIFQTSYRGAGATIPLSINLGTGEVGNLGNKLLDEGDGDVNTAWVVFTDTGTPTITNDFNVTSIADNGVGHYTLTFTNALPSAIYAWSAGCNAAAITVIGQLTGFTKSTTEFEFQVAVSATDAAIDPPECTLIFTGD